MEAICDRFRSHCFSTNQMSLLQIFALLLQNFVLYMLLQNFALLFEINCTEINQSESSNIFMYIIISVIFFFQSEVKPESSGCNELRYNLDADTIAAIFKTYPAGKTMKVTLIQAAA
jgi:hypothetical protein